MKNSKTSSKKTPTQKAKERLKASMEETSSASASPAPSPTVAKAVDGPSTVTGTENAPVQFKVWRITTFSDMADVDSWFQDKLIYILNYLLRKGRILKRKLIEFTYPEKGVVTIIWEDIETGTRITEGGAAGGVVSDDEDPLA